MKRRIPGLGRIVFGLALLLATAIVTTTTSVTEQPTVTSWGGPISVEVETAQVVAGDEFTVVVRAPVEDGTIAQLGKFGALSSTLASEPLVDGRAAFTVSALETRHRGVISIVARVRGSSSKPVDVMVLAQPAVAPVVPLVGPRTIVADGVDITMVTISPADQYANALPDGTEVATTLIETDGTVRARSDQVDGGVAAIIVTGTTETGRVTVSSTVGQADGPSNVFDQVAGAPADFAVEIDERNAVADGFNLREVKTTQLRDRFGNVLPDGIGVVFAVDTDNGSTLVNATVQGGIARSRIQAPTSAGTITVRALISGATSESTSLAFDAAVDSVPVAVSSAGEWRTLRVGPVLSTLGGYVPDGTLVSIFGSRDELAVTAEIRGGFAEVVVPDTARSLEVEVLGLRASVPGSESGS